MRITRVDSSGAKHTVDKETSVRSGGSIYFSLGINDQSKLGFCYTSLTMPIGVCVAPTDEPGAILEITTKPETLRKYNKSGWEAPLQIELRKRAPAASSAPLVAAPSSGGGGRGGGIPASGVSRPPTPPTPASLVQQQQHAALHAAYASAPAVLVAGLSAGSLMPCDGQLWQAVFTSSLPAGVAGWWVRAPLELHNTLLQWQRVHPHLWWQKLQEYAAQLLRAPVPLAAMMAAQSAAAGTGAAAK